MTKIVSPSCCNKSLKLVVFVCNNDGAVHAVTCAAQKWSGSRKGTLVCLLLVFTFTFLSVSTVNYSEAVVRYLCWFCWTTLQVQNCDLVNFAIAAGHKLQLALVSNIYNVWSFIYRYFGEKKHQDMLVGGTKLFGHIDAFCKWWRIEGSTVDIR